MALSKYDDFIQRIGAGFWMSQPIWDLAASATNGLLVTAGSTIQSIRAGQTKVPPGSLPSGVTSYIPTRLSISGQGVTNDCFLVCRAINMGSIDISGASGTFTDANQMPTANELGVSRQLPATVIAECTTATNATPGSLAITYKDQDGNAAEATTAQSITASSPIGSAGIVVLNAGDTGVIDITAATRTVGTTPTGVIKFWGVIPIAVFSMLGNVTGGCGAVNLLTADFNPVRILNGESIKIFRVSNLNTSTAILGDIYIVGDN